MNEFHDATINYADALVWYHLMILRVESARVEYGSALYEDESELIKAYDFMCDSQNRLSALAIVRARAGA